MKTTIIYHGVEFEVEFDYQPEEAQTYDYPGCGAEVNLTSIECEGIDFWEFFTQYGTDKEIRATLDGIEKEIWESFNN